MGVTNVKIYKKMDFFSGFLDITILFNRIIIFYGHQNKINFNRENPIIILSKVTYTLTRIFYVQVRNENCSLMDIQDSNYM